MPANPQDQILSIVALINALGVVIVAVIHAFRVPYRESAVRGRNESRAHGLARWVNNDPTAHAQTHRRRQSPRNGAAGRSKTVSVPNARPWVTGGVIANAPTSLEATRQQRASDEGRLAPASCMFHLGGLYRVLGGGV